MLIRVLIEDFCVGHTRNVEAQLQKLQPTISALYQIKQSQFSSIDIFIQHLLSTSNCPLLSIIEDIKMVSIEAVRASNAALNNLSPGLVALFGMDRWIHGVSMRVP